jgi:hypothetical protein
MKFTNLIWAIAQRHATHYQAAAEGNISESRFSRCLGGRAEFTEEERRKLSVFLGYPESWLFQEFIPPIPLQPTENSAGLVPV